MKSIISYLKFFLKPEFNFIIKKDLSKLISLTFILFIALFSIGLANGSFEKVKSKAEDPHIQFIDIEQVSRRSLQHGEYIKFFKKNELQEFIKDSLSPGTEISIFNVNNIEIFQNSNSFMDPLFITKTFNNYGGFSNKKEDTATFITTKSLIVERKNKFFKELIKQDFSVDSTFKDDEIGVVIKKEFLEAVLNYSLDVDTPSHVFLHTKYRRPVPVPILGIVDDIKSGCNIILTNELYNNIFRESDKMNIDTYDDIYFFFKDQQFETLDDTLKKYFNERNAWFPKKRVKGHYYQFEGNFVVDKGIRVLNFKKHPKVEEPSRIEKNFTVFLAELDEVDYLKTWLRERGVELELSKIQNKKNFNFFVRLCNYLIYAIIFFSLISVLFFVSNILFSHIDRNKKNIGTLSAFGLSNINIILLYSIITFMIIALCFFISNILSDILGYIINSQDGILGFSNDLSNLNQDLNFLDYMPNLIIKFIIFVIAPLTYLIINIYSYIYKLTPGDLIYNRK